MTTATTTSTEFEVEGEEYTYEFTYAVEGEVSGPRFPWLQADCRKPTNLSQKVNFGMTESSFSLLANPIKGDMSQASFDDIGNTVDFLAPSADVRWVILSRPRIAEMDKATKVIAQEDGKLLPLQGQMKERGKITASIVLLGCVVDDDFIRDASGDIQIFTLKLTSTKSALVGSIRDKDYGQERNKNMRTIEAMNQVLVSRQKGRANQWFGHLASIRFAVFPVIAGSADGKDKSTANHFGFEDGSGAKMLPPHLAKSVFEFISTPEFKTLGANPFNKSSKVATVSSTAPVAMAVDDEDMPF